jgi:hypothetical protein
MKKQSPSSGDAEGQPKYPEPLVLLVDLDDDAFLSLKDTGFNVLAGSFGTPYRVPSTVQGHETLCFNCYFPKNLSEQEIVIVDLTTTGPLELDETARPVMGKDGGIAFEANYREEFDPRPYTMFVFRDTFDRIISHGGIVVVFAQPRQHEEMVKITSRRRVGESIIASTWDFLWALRSVETVLDRGRDIRPAIDPESALGRLLSDHLSAAEFECTLEWDSDTWMSLAHNKYNNPVSALGVVEEGLVFIFPQIVDKASFLVRLLIEVLPEIRPSLFPHFEGRLWTRKSEYQVPDVLNLQAKITQIREDAEREIADLEKEIEELREAHSYLTDLITQQGEPLVRAVEKALQVLGFKDVVNVDELYVSEDGHPWLDEDLRITDRSPLLLVEVKGVKGVPTDEDALQVSKHLVARMKEREQTKIQGLTIINCERNLPPLSAARHRFVIRSSIMHRSSLLG